jgi:hypothetical protein
MLREQVANIIVGSVFLFAGLAACGIAVMRRRSRARALLWLGLWSAMYGVQPLANALARLGLVPKWLRVGLPYFDTVITYLIIVVATLAFLELSLGKMRLYLWVVIFVGLAIAVAGIGFFISTGSPDELIPYNQLLATCSLLVLLTVVAVPKLCRKFFVIPDRGVWAVGMLVFGMEALYANVTRPLGYQSSSIFDEPGRPLSALHRRGD